jgi:hypothetical protein
MVERNTHRRLLKEIGIMRIILPTHLSRQLIIPIIPISFNKKLFLSFYFFQSQPLKRLAISVMPAISRDSTPSGFHALPMV